MCGCQKSLIAMACDSKLPAIILWRVISQKLNVGKKITRFKIMTKKRKKLPCFQTYRTDVQTRLKYFCASLTLMRLLPNTVIGFYKWKLNLT